jgi:disulfide bond formation protein DsbB
MTTEMRPNHESRWHKPAVYWTIPALLLITEFGLSILLNRYHDYISPPPNYGLAFLRLPAEIIIYVIVGIPTIIGVVKLLQREKIGAAPAIIILAIFEFYFWLVSFQHFYAVSPEDYITGHDLQWKILGIPFLVVNLVMFAFVIKGWKMMFKKTSAV